MRNQFGEIINPNAEPALAPVSLLGVRTLDAGHLYELGSLDGQCQQTLRFVKRCDLSNPKRYHGNTNSYPGATLQIVVRALLARVGYLQGQIWCPENWIAAKLMQTAVWLWEFRAARRHGRSYWHGLRFATEAPICGKCWSYDL